MTHTSNLTFGETHQAHRVIKGALNKGYRISVYDDCCFDGQWIVSRSKSIAKIMQALGTTEGDTLRLYDRDGAIVGDITFIYGNGPGELVADHTDVPAIHELV